MKIGMIGAGNMGGQYGHGVGREGPYGLVQLREGSEHAADSGRGCRTG